MTSIGNTWIIEPAATACGERVADVSCSDNGKAL